MNAHKQWDPGISPHAVRAQLGRILGSESFARARRMQRFLEFIVEETLAGRADQLGEYGIAIGVFDRRPDFEPALDPIVRNDARRLRMKLLEYYRQTHTRAGDVLIDIPKGGYVPVFHPAQYGEPAGEAAPDTPRRVAVLPFEEISTAPESALCGLALCMSLTAGLTAVDGLEAIAHGYVRDQSFRDTASELKLTHVIHGCVWKSGGRCRVIVNLIQVSQGTQLWAREYDFEAAEMPAIHSEITGQVLREVKARLAAPPSYPRRLALAA